MAKIDPRLLSKINDASTMLNEEKIKAIVSLNPTNTKENSSQSRLPSSIVEAIENETNEKPKSVKVLPNLGVIVVEGSSEFIKQLIQHPDVSSATLSENNDFSEE